MQLFYSKNITSLNQIFDIGGQENIHLIKVLRKNIGDEIDITNGLGELFLAEILNISKKKSSLKVVRIQKTNKIVNQLSIAIAPTKNITRFEWFIEKSVEIGIFSILPFVSQNSERRNINIARLELKALNAMKQSLKFDLPLIDNLLKFEVMIKEASKNYDSLFLAFCNEKQVSFINELDSNVKTLLVIGPEGGFTLKEVEFAKQYGFVIVSLGNSRLRTETAGVFACSIFNSLKHFKI